MPVDATDFGRAPELHGPVLLLDVGEFANVAPNWLLWTFKGDKEAGKMFMGKDCSLCTQTSHSEPHRRGAVALRTD